MERIQGLAAEREEMARELERERAERGAAQAGLQQASRRGPAGRAGSATRPLPVSRETESFKRETERPFRPLSQCRGGGGGTEYAASLTRPGPGGGRRGTGRRSSCARWGRRSRYAPPADGRLRRAAAQGGEPP